MTVVAITGWSIEAPAIKSSFGPLISFLPPPGEGAPFPPPRGISVAATGAVEGVLVVRIVVRFDEPKKFQ